MYSANLLSNGPLRRKEPNAMNSLECKKVPTLLNCLDYTSGPSCSNGG